MATEGKSTIPLSWDGVVNIGYHIVKTAHPHARLHAIAAHPTSDPTSDPLELSNIQLTFGLEGFEAAVINSNPNEWGAFGPIQIIQDGGIGAGTVHWPVPLDISDAISILREGGYEQAISDVSISKPLEPQVIDQAFYTFTLSDDQRVRIGVKDRKIQA